MLSQRRGLELIRQRIRICVACFCFLVPCLAPHGLLASTTPQAQDYEGNLQLHELPSQLSQQLAQVQALLQANANDDAIEMLQRLEDEASGQLIAVPSDSGTGPFAVTRYLPFASYAERERSRWKAMFPQAWQALTSLRDEVVDSRLERLKADPNLGNAPSFWAATLASNRRPIAMLTAGSLALERGEVQRARHAFHQVDEAMRVSLDPSMSLTRASVPWHYVLRKMEAPAWPSEINNRLRPAAETIDPSLLAEAWAGLVRCSLMEADFDRARCEAQVLERIFPDSPSLDAKGTWNELVRSWLASVADRPSTETSKTTESIPDLRSLETNPLWHEVLTKHRLKPTSLSSDAATAEELDLMSGHLTYHAAIADGRVFVNSLHKIDGFDLAKGTRWPPSTSKTPLYLSSTPATDLVPLSYPVAGVMRGSVSIVDEVLYARVGPPITAWNTRSGLKEGSASSLVALDLRHEGRMVLGFPLHLKGSDWEGCEFEGTPVVVGDAMFVGITSRTSVHVRRWLACFERWTGRLRWRSPLLAAGTIDGIENQHWISHLRPAYQDGRLLFDTGLGAIAAVDASDGRLAWLTSYARCNANQEVFLRSNSFRQRDMTTPCLYRDLVLCAPADCREIFALDWGTGDLIWSTEPELTEEIEHLIGAVDEHLFASGESLCVLDLHTGEMVDRYPAAGKGKGRGQGLISQKQIYFPIAQELVEFHWDPQRLQLQERQRYDLGLAFRDGANLLANRDYLAACTSDRISLFYWRATEDQTKQER